VSYVWARPPDPSTHYASHVDVNKFRVEGEGDRAFLECADLNCPWEVAAGTLGEMYEAARAHKIEAHR